VIEGEVDRQWCHQLARQGADAALSKRMRCDGETGRILEVVVEPDLARWRWRSRDERVDLGVELDQELLGHDISNDEVPLDPEPLELLARQHPPNVRAAKAGAPPPFADERLAGTASRRPSPAMEGSGLERDGAARAGARAVRR